MQRDAARDLSDERPDYNFPFKTLFAASFGFQLLAI